VEKKRFQVRWISAAEGAKFAAAIREVIDAVRELGPNPLGRSHGTQAS
jgi:F420-non-reducing hydrogenase iron-sulfur subunit